MHHQYRYGQLPAWKTEQASQAVRSIYGMWSPTSLVMRLGPNVLHADGRRSELVYTSEDRYMDHVHERGLLIVKEKEILLARMRRGKSEQRWIWRGAFDRHEACSDGAVVENHGKLFLATPWGRPHLIHPGPFDAWHAHPQGAIVRSFGRLILATKNGAKALLDVEEMDRLKTDEGEEGWIVHKDGVMYMQEHRLYLAKSLMYRELLHDFNPTVRKWVPQELGCGKEHSLIAPGAVSAEEHRRLRLSGCTWGFHPDGCIVQYEDNLDLITDDGRVNLFHGKWDGWASHPYGIVVRKGQEIKLYDGERGPMRLMDLPTDVRFGATPFSGIVLAGNGDMRTIF